MSKPLDQLGRGLQDLRLSVIDRCNLRCQYCMPKEVFGKDFGFMPEAQLMSFDEMEQLVATFIELGVQKVRLTGGEPLLRPRLPELVSRLRTLSPTLDIAMTTNGTRLARSVVALAEAGLDRVNISLDALDATVSEQMAGRAVNLSQVEAGIAAAQAAGLPLKLNTVIKRGVNEGEIVPLAKFARERGVALRFIEYMDVGTTNAWAREEVVTGAEVLARLQEAFELAPAKHREGSEIAQMYGYADSDCHVGFINSISQPFCQGCNRARVSADGKLYTCLFASEGLDLKPWLRGEHPDETLAELLTRSWQARQDRYSEQRFSQEKTAKPQRAEMWTLGG